MIWAGITCAMAALSQEEGLVSPDATAEDLGVTSTGDLTAQGLIDAHPLLLFMTTMS